MVNLNDSKQLYQFGPFCLRVPDRVLLRLDEVIPLMPKTVETLIVLVSHHGQIVSKEKLLELIWPDVIVDENNLIKHVSELRKVLGEDSEGKKYIETIPRRGYRFQASVTELAATFPAAVVPNQELIARPSPPLRLTNPAPPVSTPVLTPSLVRWSKSRSGLVGGFLLILGFLLAWRVVTRTPAVSEAARIRSLAVLPFKAIGLSKEDSYLGIGLTDMLITELSHNQRIIIRPTGVVSKYGDTDFDPLKVGEKLGVEAVLEGRLQREKEQLRVTLQLLNIATGALLWSGKFEGDVNDLFGLQDALFQSVAQTLALPLEAAGQRITATRHTPLNEAYTAYLKGRHHMYRFTIEDGTKGLNYFKHAVATDPQFALAYTGLAQSYVMAAEWFLPPKVAWPAAQEAAEKAVALDEKSSEAHTALAMVKAQYQWDWAGTESHLKRAIELNPRMIDARDWYGWYLLWQGRNEDALQQIQEAQAIDPLSGSVGTDLGTWYYCQRQFEPAALEFQKLIGLYPTYRPAQIMLGWTRLQQGRFAEAIQGFEKARQLDDSPADIAALGLGLAKAGKKTEALQLLSELQKRAAQEYVSPFDFATIYLGLNDRDQFFAWLEKAYQEHSNYLIYLKRDPMFDEVRADPRFGAMLARITW